MNTIDNLSGQELKELLVKGWMTHDAMWFYHSLQEYGIEQTNKINLAAIRSMAAVEVKRMQKALGMGKGKPESYEEVRALFDGMMSIVRGKFMDFDDSWLSEKRVRWEYHSCWAYTGVKGLGVIDKYQCGVILRVTTWFETLGIRCDVIPPVEGCLMHRNGRCAGEISFEL